MSKKTQLRICRISSAFPPPWTGLNPGPYALGFAQHRRGTDVTVITRDVSGAKEVDGGIPFAVERVRAKFDLEFSFKAYKRFRELHRTRPFDIIHAHGFSGFGILALRKLRDIGLPLITTVHCVRYTQRLANKKAMDTALEDLHSDRETPSQLFLKWEALQERFVVSHSRGLIAVSEGVRNDLINAYGIASGKIYVVGNGVDTNQFRPTEQASVNGIGGINLLWVGRFSGFKGEFDLVSAADILRQQRVNFQLEMVGDGKGRMEVARSIKGRELDNYVHIIPNVAFCEISRFYQRADVFILPSVSEGMPKVVLEAMACGLPVIASDIPGCKELVRDGKNGFLVPVNKPHLLAEAIKTFFIHPERIKVMGQESRKIVATEYTWDAVAQSVENCYRNLLERQEVHSGSKWKQ